jgi:cysteine desulfuration protein SufE
MRNVLSQIPTITPEELIDEFEFLDSMEERYGLIIDMGKELPPLPENFREDGNKVQGCQSQVWLVAQTTPEEPVRLQFQADSDSQIVKGLVAILVMLLSNKTPREILDFDLKGLFDRLELGKHLSPSRANGLNSMIRRIAELAVEHA